MGNFRFKRFGIRQERTAMKVNTDGVLLGAWMDVLPGDRSLLDIGTGSGVIALMAAQRLEECRERKRIKEAVNSVRPVWQAGERVSGCARGPENFPESVPEVIGLEIDSGSYEDARLNFENAPWKFLKALPVSLQQYAEKQDGKKFDLIFCNPPYFIHSLKCPDGNRCAARHTVALEQGELIRDALKLVRPGGRLAVILPAAEGGRFLGKIRFIEEKTMRAESPGLFFRPARLCKVYTSGGKPAKRYLMEFVAERGPGRIPERGAVRPDEVPGLSAASSADSENDKVENRLTFTGGPSSEEAGRNKCSSECRLLCNDFPFRAKMRPEDIGLKDIPELNAETGATEAFISGESSQGKHYGWENLYLMKNGAYTPEYVSLIKDFYLNF